MGRDTAPQEVRTGMTDTEMLDYLQQAMSRDMPRDVQIGTVCFTARAHSSLRQSLRVAIEQDQIRCIGMITRKLEQA